LLLLTHATLGACLPAQQQCSYEQLRHQQQHLGSAVQRQRKPHQQLLPAAAAPAAAAA
jgi:hypothetical protein